MSTFLQLVNQTMVEAGTAGSALTTLQGSLSAEAIRFKNWINYEWQRIQADKVQWQWMRQSGTFPTLANQAQYTIAAIGATSTPAFAAATFGNWIRRSFRFYLDPAFGDEQLAAFITWDQFRDLYLYGANRTNSSRPVAFTVGPDKSLWLGMRPDQVYTCVYEYYQSAIGLSADADTPAMPAQYHDLIVFRALKAYGAFMSAEEVIGRANEEIARITPKLCADQLPIVFGGPPLA